jgi:hypothetical protein
MSDYLRDNEIKRILQESSAEYENIDEVQNLDFSSDEAIEYNSVSDVSEIGGEEEVCEELLDDQDFVLGKDGETIWSTTAVANVSKSKSLML